MRLKWVLENDERVRKLAHKGHVMFGTIDTWLIYKLTEGKVNHPVLLPHVKSTPMLTLVRIDVISIDTSLIVRIELYPTQKITVYEYIYENLSIFNFSLTSVSMSLQKLFSVHLTDPCY